MLDIILNVFFVLIAVAMIALILLQRGAGAQAGSGFGSGASGTVFGAQGSANFLSKTTKWLAVVFFALSLFMAWRATHPDNRGEGPAAASEDLGVMGDLKDQPAVPAASTDAAPAAAAPAPVIPAADAPASDAVTPAAEPQGEAAKDAQAPAPEAAKQ